jgi:hypothetical protein
MNFNSCLRLCFKFFSICHCFLKRDEKVVFFFFFFFLGGGGGGGGLFVLVFVCIFLWVHCCLCQIISLFHPLPKKKKKNPLSSVENKVPNKRI